MDEKQASGLKNYLSADGETLKLLIFKVFQ